MRYLEKDHRNRVKIFSFKKRKSSFALKKVSVFQKGGYIYSTLHVTIQLFDNLKKPTSKYVTCESLIMSHEYVN